MATPDNTQKEGKVVELQEELITRLKELIKVALVNGTSAEDLKSQAEKYIKDFLKEHKDLEGKYSKLYNEWQRVFYSNFNTMYYITKRTADDIFKKQRDKKSEEIYKDLKKAYKDNTQKPNLDKSKESYVFGSNKEIDPQNITAQNAPNLKFIRTSAEYGYTQMQIDDYVEKVEKVMDKVANLGFVATNKVGARISLRNKAEMEVRYQDMLSDLEALKEDKFVIVSQHKDASLRCACWQGLIYLKDTDGTDISLKNWHEWNNIKNHITPKPIGTLPNGQPYYSLKDAMEHGLFSYNCRHRFIKYEVGTKVPPQYHYDPNKESEASLIDKKMRQMEEEIRKAKERQNLALTPEERKKWQAKSKALQKKYDEFAKAHNRVRNDWRTSIGRLAERPHMKGIEQGSGEPYISPKKSMKEAGLVRSGIMNEKNIASKIGASDLQKPTKEISKTLDNVNVEKREVRKLEKTLSDNKIISKVGGKDNTLGSCASLALSYIANKIGYDVTDYRDGASRSIFADQGTLDKITNIEGLNKFEMKASNELTHPNQIFDKCWENTISGKEYLVITGCHAAIVKEKNNKKHYLELQFAPEQNGWKKWTSKTLTERFKCNKKCNAGDKCVIVDIESFKNIEFDFVNILSYINTRNYEEDGGDLKNDNVIE